MTDQPRTRSGGAGMLRKHLHRPADTEERLPQPERDTGLMIQTGVILTVVAIVVTMYVTFN